MRVAGNIFNNMMRLGQSGAPSEATASDKKPGLRPLSIGLGIVCASDLFFGGLSAGFVARLHTAVDHGTACLLGTERLMEGCEIGNWSEFASAPGAAWAGTPPTNERSPIPGLGQLTPAEVEMLRQAILDLKAQGVFSQRLLPQLSTAEREALVAEGVLVARPDSQERVMNGEAPLTADQLDSETRRQLQDAGALPRLSEGDLDAETRQRLIDSGVLAQRGAEDLTPDQRTELGLGRFTADEIRAARMHFGI